MDRGVNVNFEYYYSTRQYEKAGPLNLRAVEIEIGEKGVVVENLFLRSSLY